MTTGYLVAAERLVGDGNGKGGKDFTLLRPGVGVGQPPSGWQALSRLPLLILVGVSGVGKSTTLAALRQISLGQAQLPDRRTLTDRLIIAPLLKPGQPQPDRIERLEFTRRYRQLHPGGMAHVLAQLCIGAEIARRPLIFDGLRGVNEVSFAAAALPRARFIVLHAADFTRLKRLLQRNDTFDQIKPNNAIASGVTGPLRDALSVPGADQLFSKQEQDALRELVRRKVIKADDLIDKMRIVVEERRSYEPLQTIAALRQLAPTRTLVIDTEQCEPQQVARLVQRMQAFTTRPLTY